MKGRQNANKNMIFLSSLARYFSFQEKHVGLNNLYSFPTVYHEEIYEKQWG